MLIGSIFSNIPLNETINICIDNFLNQNQNTTNPANICWSSVRLENVFKTFLGMF